MTRPAWKKIWPFLQRPLGAKWIKRKIEASANAQLNELRRIEAQIQNLRDTMDARHNEHRATFKKMLEVRTQLAVHEAMAYADHTFEALNESSRADHASIRKIIEIRAQLAADEAKGYADHGLGSLSRSLGAASRAAVKTAKRVDEVESELNARSNSLRSAVDANVRRLAATEALAKSLSEQRELDAGRIESLAHDAVATRAGFETRIESIRVELNRIVSDYNAQLRNAEHRIEFIRSEAMYEMQVSSYRMGGRVSPSRTVPRLINAAKVDAMRAEGLRLNVGCGHIQLDDYINVDRRALPGIDIVADANDIPFEENELTEIRSSHLVEHFTSHILERVLLPHWSALLKPGGILTTIAPDGAAMLKAVNSGEIEFEDFREVLFGAQDYDGDFHYNMVTPITFSKSLKTAGFKNITEEYVGKRNGKCFEFKIVAEKA